MDITLSRRVAKVLITDKMLRQSVRERYDFVKEVSKYRKFDDLPRNLKAVITGAEN